jgi:hypothetical protein
MHNAAGALERLLGLGTAGSATAIWLGMKIVGSGLTRG